MLCLPYAGFLDKQNKILGINCKHVYCQSPQRMYLQYFSGPLGSPGEPPQLRVPDNILAPRPMDGPQVLGRFSPQQLQAVDREGAARAAVAPVPSWDMRVVVEKVVRSTVVEGLRSCYSVQDGQVEVQEEGFWTCSACGNT